MRNILVTVMLFALIFVNSCNAEITDKVQREQNSIHERIKQITYNCDSTLPTGWYYVIENNGCKRELDRDTIDIMINPEPIVSVHNIIRMEIYKGQSNDVGLMMQLDDIGTEKWLEATEKTIGKKLAFVFDNKVLHTPLVNSQITNGMTALNRGIYSEEELESIKNSIQKDIENK